MEETERGQEGCKEEEEEEEGEEEEEKRGKRKKERVEHSACYLENTWQRGEQLSHFFYVKKAKCFLGVMVGKLS